jgi:phosphatidylglycerophosphate synthase
MATESYRETLERLRAAQKGAARSAPAYSRFVNRRIGRYLAAWAHQRGLSPNAVTGISALFTTAAIALLALVPPSWPMGAAVTVLLLTGYAFDSADGQVARLRGGGSSAGEWLDHMVDAAKVSVLPLALAVGFYRFEVVDVRWLLVPLAFSVVSAVLFFAMILTEQLRRQHGVVSGGSGAHAPSALRSVLVVPTDYGLLCLSFVLLGAVDAFVLLYSFLFLATAGFLLLAAVRWYREMAALRPASRTGSAAHGAGEPRDRARVDSR